MIVVDFTNVMIANIYAHDATASDISPDMLRHMILNSVRAIKKRYGRDYGEIVLACDERSWRRNIFPYYKASRDKNKDKSLMDWEQLFQIMRMIRAEIKEVFPYRVVEAAGAEADDIIGTLVMDNGVDGLAFGEKIMIISGDKDYAQLHRYANVEQYDWVKKRVIVPKDDDGKIISAEEYLIRHVLKGDSGDGVPNVLSPDDCFVVGTRQKPMTKKRIEELKKIFTLSEQTHPDIPADIMQRVSRNLKLIDLRHTPEEIRVAIRKEYEAQAGKNKSKIFNYFIEKRLRNLMAEIGDF